MTSTHKYHVISIQYPPHKCLLEKSCLHCLRILIMSWLFKDPINEDVPFSGPKWPICHEKKYFSANHYYYFNYLLDLFIVQNSKKFLQQIQSYEDAQFSGPKWSISPNEFFFFRKPANEPCFFHSLAESYF